MANEFPQADSLTHITVLHPGLHSRLVDFGRARSRSLGVPVGGAADRVSFSIGNALVGNGPGAVALEMNLAGPALLTDAAIAGVVYGAPFELASSRQSLVAGKTFTLETGEKLHVGGTASLVCAYLCVRGGFHTPQILDSRSALEPLTAGALLTCLTGRIGTHFVREHFADQDDLHVLRVLCGRQADWFNADEFYSQEFTVRPDRNRMGLRLDGRPLARPARELISEPVCPGTVQVTTSGQCIVLGRDGQTIGGYPKIAQVISADLDKLGRLRPGAPVCFERVDQETAEQLFRRRERELGNWLTRLRTAAAGGY